MFSKRTIQRILKVNHAGEYGAIRIYRAQLLVAKLIYPNLVPFLQETLAHEVEHCALFRTWLTHYQARPCRAMWLWSSGGFLLGFTTSLLGSNAVMLCTKAVEETVHNHMQEQILFLKNYDTDLENAISTVQVQELEHLRFAQERCKEKTVLATAITLTVTHTTELVIWLSTWGDSTRMRRELV